MPTCQFTVHEQAASHLWLLFLTLWVVAHMQTAVVFGHGNVAIDIARMLMMPIDQYGIAALSSPCATAALSSAVRHSGSVLCRALQRLRLLPLPLQLLLVHMHRYHLRRLKKCWFHFTAVHPSLYLYSLPSPHARPKRFPSLRVLCM